jgi:hypothetical protein
MNKQLLPMKLNSISKAWFKKNVMQMYNQDLNFLYEVPDNNYKSYH